MNIAGFIVAKKYATAFLNVFIDDISYDDIQHARQAVDFFSRHHTLLFFLTWPKIDTSAKVNALRHVLQRFSLGHQFEKLLLLLARQQRTHLISSVLKQICAMYYERKNIAHVTITSSHELKGQDVQTIQQFLANILAASIIYDYKVDKTLIAGIRLQSDTSLWEYSIRKQLAQIKLQLIR